MTLPPGYGYPSHDDWTTRNDLSLFERGLILVFQIVGCAAVALFAAIIVGWAAAAIWSGITA